MIQGLHGQITHFDYTRKNGDMVEVEITLLEIDTDLGKKELSHHPENYTIYDSETGCAKKEQISDKELSDNFEIWLDTTAFAIDD